MNLGVILRETREKSRISRQALAEGICSSKYIYLIEKGEREPSTQIVEALGYKLNVDLFEYLPYQDCKDPVVVKDYMDRFERYRMRRDFENLSKFTAEALQLSDFCKLPWQAELEYNRLIIDILGNGRFEDALVRIEESIFLITGQLPSVGGQMAIACPTLARLYNLLAIYHLNSGNREEGAAYLAFAYKELFQKRYMKKYQPMYISIATNYLNVCLLEEKYEAVVDEALELLAFQRKSNWLDRVHLTHFILARAYRELGNEAASLSHLKSCLCMGLALDLKEDLSELFKYDFIKAFGTEGLLTVNLYDAALQI